MTNAKLAKMLRSAASGLEHGRRASAIRKIFGVARYFEYLQRDECRDCETVVTPEDPFYRTPCGTYCQDHMASHVRECGRCRPDFY